MVLWKEEKGERYWMSLLVEVIVYDQASENIAGGPWDIAPGTNSPSGQAVHKMYWRFVWPIHDRWVSST